jgi:hypothetical protein
MFVVLTLAGLGTGVAYAYATATPEKRICRDLDKLCGGRGSVARCEADFAEIEKALGPDALERMAECTDDSDSCADAVGCVAGGSVTGVAHIVSQFSQGFDRALNPGARP